jgi:molybdopterin-dependent oxidoreductase alpha subunit
VRPRIGARPPPLERGLAARLKRFIPFGLGLEKPKHFREMLSVALENSDNLAYAWRILRHGVCDGCSLGPRGLTDDVIPGHTHLCLSRLKLLRLNTQGALDPARLADLSRLEGLGGAALQKLGRLPSPLVWREGRPGYEPLSWDAALELAAEVFRSTRGERTAWFATSRGLYNEAYYTFQKVARLLGSPHVDYCARLCHAPSGYGLSDIFGVGAPNCSLEDLIGTDLLVLWGTNLANNQPVALKYIALARKRGTRVVVINPYREPGLERYWIPSSPLSALFGTRIRDDFFQVGIGGDIAFVNGVLKALVEKGGLADEFLAAQASGVEEGIARLRAMSWEDLERQSGLGRRDMERFAALYREARTAVFVYSMGLTQHRFGVENVRSIAVLALARGMIGRPKCGVLPIRGHSGVQGGSEMGVAPDKFPGGMPVGEAGARHWENAWGAPVPSVPGKTATAQVEGLFAGEFDILYTIGGNLLETLPSPQFARAALGRLRLRIHQDIVLNTSMLIPAPLVLLLPAATRYETPGGVTATSTERRIRFSPEIAGRRIAGARPEWEIPVLLARQLLAEGERLLPYRGAADVRREIERLVPLYRGIGGLSKEGDHLQWGGARLFEDGFREMPGGRARFWVQELPEVEVPAGMYYLTTRRGKQFNSMLHGEEDPLTGSSRRDVVFLSAADLEAEGIAPGERVRLTSEAGSLEATAAAAPVKRRTLQAFWPEANVLIPRRYDPISGEPDYNAFVKLAKLGAEKKRNADSTDCRE